MQKAKLLHHLHNNDRHHRQHHRHQVKRQGMWMLKRQTWTSIWDSGMSKRLPYLMHKLSITFEHNSKGKKQGSIVSVFGLCARQTAYNWNNWSTDSLGNPKPNIGIWVELCSQKISTHYIASSVYPQTSSSVSLQMQYLISLFGENFT